MIPRLAKGAKWMMRGERAAYRKLFAQLAEEGGNGDSAFLALRINDVASSFLYVCRLEDALEANLAPAPADAAAVKPEGKRHGAVPTGASLLALIDALGKARERLRKAMTELESYLRRAGGARNIGLADMMKPLILQAQGAWEETSEADKRAILGLDPLPEDPVPKLDDI